MRYKVYRSLDKPSVFAGIKGSYIFITLGMIGIGAVVALIVGSIVGSLLGTFLFIVIVAVSYGVTMFIQEKRSFRELGRMLAARKLPNHLVIDPRNRLLDYSHRVSEHKDKSNAG